MHNVLIQSQPVLTVSSLEHGVTDYEVTDKVGDVMIYFIYREGGFFNLNNINQTELDDDVYAIA